MRNVLFEDHTYRRFRPLAWSLPTYEIRCGIFNTRERLELSDPGGGGLVLCRQELAPLHTAPGWSWNVVAPVERTLWLNGRLAPRADLVMLLHEMRQLDWVLADDQGLLAASLPAPEGARLMASWQTWRDGAEAEQVWQVPDFLLSIAAPDLSPLPGALDLGWIWDIVPATSEAIANDLTLVAGGRPYGRHPFGIYPTATATWSQQGSLRLVGTGTLPELVHVIGKGGLYLGNGGVDLAPGTHVDTTNGPVVLDGGVTVMPHAYLEGPLYVGRGSMIKPGARIFGQSSFGVVNRLAGEIGESTFGEFANKQHDGFIGHAVLGSWINLGAMPTCSDLKNNYGPVRVDLGLGVQDTGRQFVGLLMGDHAKTAIGSLFNTGTCVGFASNIFGEGMPPKHVPHFSWGGRPGDPAYDLVPAQKTAEVVMGRRQCGWTEDHANLFAFLHERS